MKIYELTYLLPSTLPENEIRKFQEDLESFIQKEEGVIFETFSPLKKKLAYPIKKNLETYLVSINFQIKPEKISILEKKLKDENRILRYLILKKEIKKIVHKIKPKILKSKPMKKVELKEIEKKLEEILEE